MMNKLYIIITIKNNICVPIFYFNFPINIQKKEKMMQINRTI
jgi:hypothetical protein